MGQLSVAFVLERCDLALEKHVTLPVAHVCALYAPAHTAYTFTHIIHAQLRGAYTYMIGTHNCTLECKLIMQVYSYHAHAHTHLSTTVHTCIIHLFTQYANTAHIHTHFTSMQKHTHHASTLSHTFIHVSTQQTLTLTLTNTILIMELHYMHTQRTHRSLCTHMCITPLHT